MTEKKDRKTVGYVRSIRKNSAADCNMQSVIIKRYATEKALQCDLLYMDTKVIRNRNSKDLSRAKRLGITNPEYTKCFPAWEEMLCEAMDDQIDAIIVDRRERLYGNAADLTLLERICQKNCVMIYDINTLSVSNDPSCTNVAIYHYYVPNIRGKGIRTANLINELGAMYEVVSQHMDWHFCGLYLDSWAYKHTELPKLLESEDIDIIICNHFYHINRKILPFLKTIQEMNEKNTTFMSINEGIFHYDPDPCQLSEKNLRAITCDCCRSENEEKNREITNRRFELFYKTRTKWQEIGNRMFLGPNISNEFNLLRSDSKEFDIVVVDTFTKIGSSINELVRFIKAIKAPVYSLQEGLVYIDGEEKQVQGYTIQQGFDSS